MKLAATSPSRTPVVVGVGQWTRHPVDVAESPEPAAMMAETLRRAASDAGGGERLLQAATGLWTVALTSWSYADPATTVAELLRIDPRHRLCSSVGGEQPQVLVSRAARAIAAGEHDVVLICGAEAFRSRRLAKSTGRRLSWSPRPHDRRTGFPRQLLDGEPGLPVEQAAGATLPLDFYALFENAVRGDAGRSLSDHQDHLGNLWHRFALVAERNEHAWIRTAPSPREIASPSPSNRMIRFPYTKMLTSNIWVDMSAAVIVCSEAKARALGIPTDRWVFPVAAAESSDHWFVSERDELHRSPAIRANGRTAFQAAGVHPGDVRYIDIYSCFPSAVQIAARELALADDPDVPLTLTGGLTFAGGPGNNYVCHGLAALVEALRHDHGAVGLQTANGMFLTKHALALYSTKPPTHGFRWDTPQDWVDAQPKRELVEGYSGLAKLETYTVAHRDADDLPSRAVLIGRTPDGRRSWASAEDPDLLHALETQQLVGCTYRLSHQGIEVLD
jgi:acetyl-CoA C-acetyltransferase